MTPRSHTTKTLLRPLLAVLVLVAMIATACGSTVVQTTAERSVDTTAARPADSAVDAAETATPPGAAPDPASGTSHQYGATLEEFGQSVRGGEPAQESSVGDTAAADQSDSLFIEWEDLIPAGSSGQDIVARFQERLDAVEPGTAEASALYAEMQAEFDPNAINPELDGQQIRLAGFVAPLTYDDQTVTEFLLVPTFGACIHVPPPPPNQTIMVTVDQADGLSLEDSWGAVWVEGTLTVAFAETELAEASYTITGATSGVYDDF